MGVIAPSRSGGCGPWRPAVPLCLSQERIREGLRSSAPSRQTSPSQASLDPAGESEYIQTDPARAPLRVKPYAAGGTPVARGPATEPLDTPPRGALREMRRLQQAGRPAFLEEAADFSRLLLILWMPMRLCLRSRRRQPPRPRRSKRMIEDFIACVEGQRKGRPPRGPRLGVAATVPAAELQAKPKVVYNSPPADLADPAPAAAVKAPSAGDIRRDRADALYVCHADGSWRLQNPHQQRMLIKIKKLDVEVLPYLTEGSRVLLLTGVETRYEPVAEAAGSSSAAPAKSRGITDASCFSGLRGRNRDPPPAIQAVPVGTPLARSRQGGATARCRRSRRCSTASAKKRLWKLSWPLQPLGVPSMSGRLPSMDRDTSKPLSWLAKMEPESGFLRTTHSAAALSSNGRLSKGLKARELPCGLPTGHNRDNRAGAGLRGL